MAGSKTCVFMCVCVLQRHSFVLKLISRFISMASSCGCHMKYLHISCFIHRYATLLCRWSPWRGWPRNRRRGWKLTRTRSTTWRTKLASTRRSPLSFTVSAPGRIFHLVCCHSTSNGHLSTTGAGEGHTHPGRRWELALAHWLNLSLAILALILGQGRAHVLGNETRISNHTQIKSLIYRPCS